MIDDRKSSAGDNRPVLVTLSGGVLTASVTTTHLTSNEATHMQSLVIARMEEAANHLRIFVLDLAQVTYMNSMGLGVCIELRNRAARRNARCIVTGLQKSVADLFDLMKVDRLFEVAHDAAELERLLRRPHSS